MLFSSFPSATQDLHFRWMKEYVGEPFRPRICSRTLMGSGGTLIWGETKQPHQRPLGCGGLRLSLSADVRALDDVIAFERYGLDGVFIQRFVNGLEHTSCAAGNVVACQMDNITYHSMKAAEATGRVRMRTWDTAWGTVHSTARPRHPVLFATALCLVRTGVSWFDTRSIGTAPANAVAYPCWYARRNACPRVPCWLTVCGSHETSVACA